MYARVGWRLVRHLSLDTIRRACTIHTCSTMCYRYVLDGAILGARLYPSRALEEFPVELVTTVVAASTEEPATVATTEPVATTAEVIATEVKTVAATTAAVAVATQPSDCNDDSFYARETGTCKLATVCVAESSSEMCPGDCQVCLLGTDTAYCSVCENGRCDGP